VIRRDRKEANVILNLKAGFCTRRARSLLKTEAEGMKGKGGSGEKVSGGWIILPPAIRGRL
jgi:hypothetical protein